MTFTVKAKYNNLMQFDNGRLKLFQKARRYVYKFIKPEGKKKKKKKKKKNYENKWQEGILLENIYIYTSTWYRRNKHGICNGFAWEGDILVTKKKKKKKTHTHTHRRNAFLFHVGE